MGLSGPRKRSKLSHDPNNTNWSRSESKYGQRILQSQGWNPGDYLGAKDASHAKYHTVASSSHIKVALREDNLGLGARVGAAGGEWEPTGLGGFQDLLGRLNGKTEEELGKAQKSRETLKKSFYAEQRWGTLRFVSGGLLVGEKIEEVKKEVKAKDSRLENNTHDVGSVAAPTVGQMPQSQIDSKSKSKSKSKKKSKKLDRVDAPHAPSKMGHMTPEGDAEISTTALTTHAIDKAQRRAEKAARKLQRRLRREARLERKTQPQSRRPSPSLSAQAPPVIRELAEEDAASSQSRHGIQTVRHCHLKQKKLAMMDSKALKEILMIKP